MSQKPEEPRQFLPETLQSAGGRLFGIIAYEIPESSPAKEQVLDAIFHAHFKLHWIYFCRLRRKRPLFRFKRQSLLDWNFRGRELLRGEQVEALPSSMSLSSGTEITLTRENTVFLIEEVKVNSLYVMRHGVGALKCPHCLKAQAEGDVGADPRGCWLREFFLETYQGPEIFHYARSGRWHRYGLEARVCVKSKKFYLEQTITDTSEVDVGPGKRCPFCKSESIVVRDDGEPGKILHCNACGKTTRIAYGMDSRFANGERWVET